MKIPLEHKLNGFSETDNALDACCQAKQKCLSGHGTLFSNGNRPWENVAYGID